MTQPSTAIMDGVTKYYAEYRSIAADQTPDIPWPRWENLTADQVQLWILAYSSTCEMSVRITQAMISLDLTS